MANYFPHDNNARNDDKIIAIRMKHGFEGYGVYFAILERLMECSNYIHVKDYNVIAFDLRVENSIVKSIVEDFGLFDFTEDGKCFYSGKFNERMKPLDNLREQRRQAGLKSAEKRTAVQRPFNDRSTTVEENSNNKIRLDKTKEKENNLFIKSAQSFFYIGLDLIKQKISDHAKENYQQAIETYLIGKNLSEAKLLQELDLNFPPGYEFATTNHFRNAIKSTVDKLTKQQHGNNNSRNTPQDNRNPNRIKETGFGTL